MLGPCVNWPLWPPGGRRERMSGRKMPRGGVGGACFRAAVARSRAVATGRCLAKPVMLLLVLLLVLLLLLLLVLVLLSQLQLGEAVALLQQQTQQQALRAALLAAQRGGVGQVQAEQLSGAEGEQRQPRGHQEHGMRGVAAAAAAAAAVAVAAAAAEEEEEEMMTGDEGGLAGAKLTGAKFAR